MLLNSVKLEEIKFLQRKLINECSLEQFDAFSKNSRSITRFNDPEAWRPMLNLYFSLYPNVRS